VTTHADAIASLDPAALAEGLLEVVDAFRIAAPAWGKTELAHWLHHAYAPCTRFVPRETKGARAWPELLDDPSLPATIAAARAALIEACDELFPTGRVELTWSCVRSGLVVPKINAIGEELWLPVDLANATLSERVLSLLAATYLIAPSRFEEDDLECAFCGKKLGPDDTGLRCAEHASVASGIPGAVEDEDIPVEWSSGTDDD
jgi:hypothetical protein